MFFTVLKVSHKPRDEPVSCTALAHRERLISCAFALPGQCLSGESITSASTWPHSPAAQSCSLGKEAEMLCPGRNVLVAEHCQCLQHCQEPFSQAHISLSVGWCSAEFKLCTNPTCPGRELCARSCRGCSSLPWGWEPNSFLHKPTDGCLAFLSINNHFCYRETTVTVLWNLFPIRIPQDFAKRRNKNVSKAFYLLYGEKFDCDLSAALLKYVTAVLNIPFFLLGLISYYARLFFKILFKPFQSIYIQQN